MCGAFSSYGVLVWFLCLRRLQNKSCWCNLKFSSSLFELQPYGSWTHHTHWNMARCPSTFWVTAQSGSGEMTIIIHTAADIVLLIIVFELFTLCVLPCCLSSCCRLSAVNLHHGDITKLSETCKLVFLSKHFTFFSTHRLHFLRASPPPLHRPCLRCGIGSPSSLAGGRWESQTVRWGRRGRPPQRSCRVGEVPQPWLLIQS